MPIVVGISNITKKVHDASQKWAARKNQLLPPPSIILVTGSNHVGLTDGLPRILLKNTKYSRKRSDFTSEPCFYANAYKATRYRLTVTAVWAGPPGRKDISWFTISCLVMTGRSFFSTVRQSPCRRF
jgi:hypothetical protein